MHLASDLQAAIDPAITCVKCSNNAWTRLRLVIVQVVIELFSGMNPPHRTIADVQDDSLSGRW